MRAHPRFRVATAAATATFLLAAIPDGSPGQTPRWSSREVARAGTVDGPGALSGIFDVEVRRDGWLFVSQPQVGIAVFDADARYVRTLGRPGPGPGEFRTLGRLGWKGDTLWAIDFDRVHLYDRDLEHASTVSPRLGVTDRGRRVLTGPLMADGSVLLVTMQMVPGDEPVPILDADRNGLVLRVLAEERDAQRRFRYSLPDGRAVSSADYFPSHTLWVHEAGGGSIVMVNRRIAEDAEDPAFTVLRIGLNGDTLMRREIRYPPRPVERDLADRLYRASAEFRASSAGITVAAAERAIRDAVPMPRFATPVSDLVPGTDGTIWLRREDLREDSVEWQVLALSGETIGWLTLPAGLEIHRVAADRIWASVTGELDVPFIVVREVVRPGSG